MIVFPRTDRTSTATRTRRLIASVYGDAPEVVGCPLFGIPRWSDNSRILRQVASRLLSRAEWESPIAYRVVRVIAVVWIRPFAIVEQRAIFIVAMRENCSICHRHGGRLTTRESASHYPVKHCDRGNNQLERQFCFTIRIRAGYVVALTSAVADYSMECQSQLPSCVP